MTDKVRILVEVPECHGVRFETNIDKTNDNIINI